MGKFKKPSLFALCLLPIATAAGIFTGFYQLEVYSEEILTELTAQLGSTGIFIIVCTAQTLCYALFCGFFGYIFADRLGLWRPFRFEKPKVLRTLIISLVGGAVLSLDHWLFGSAINGIQSANAAGLTASGVLASILYGGIIEEVMLRLFFMSLLALIILKLFFRKHDSEHIPTAVFVIANIIAAFVFAAGHLPASISIFGGLTPLIVLRCFLFNGGFGLIFGWLYRKYGIAYSMLSHMTVHIVSKLIWFAFI